MTNLYCWVCKDYRAMGKVVNVGTREHGAWIECTVELECGHHCGVLLHKSDPRVLSAKDPPAK